MTLINLISDDIQNVFAFVTISNIVYDACIDVQSTNASEVFIIF